MSKSVLVKDIKNMIKNKNVPMYDVTFGDGKDVTPITVHMKGYISIDNETLFVNRMCDAIFHEGIYQPEYYRVMFAIFTMQTLSDLPIPKKRDNTEFFDIDEFKKWDSVFHFMETIQNGDNENLKNYIKYLDNISRKKIEFVKARIQNESKLDELFASVKVLSDKFAEKLDGIDLTKMINQYANNVVAELKPDDSNG